MFKERLGKTQACPKLRWMGFVHHFVDQQEQGWCQSSVRVGHWLRCGISLIIGLTWWGQHFSSQWHQCAIKEQVGRLCPWHNYGTIMEKKLQSRYRDHWKPEPQKPSKLEWRTRLRVQRRGGGMAVFWQDMYVACRGSQLHCISR